ncbi:phosphatidylglycerol lysyltransferase domain-containing protein [Amphiplicatus metriothermophilus]|uniref:Uncharacterized conserved protein n=1 Tax=Amphiplicatus metriothermophilus TaxID=1519374 RepID=A0A239PPM9_9PROT|nr:GNAT family N-acetyltransferase [Amphiplicatus metriothermophilus]MBB5518617.1 lysylphosphatidylglycerol synthetase-like protein (DUF2156 family) [Amphiplicatus metriothermophilus]SNT72225.1 Uncharacterized conserved protein [Amphiplicatus metriothermophilus]
MFDAQIFTPSVQGPIHVHVPPAGGALRRFRPPPPPVGNAAEIERAARALRDAEIYDGDSFLALTGDKRFVWSASGASFLMFGVWGRAWIAMGGPVGRADEFDEVAARFAEAARAARAWPAYYAVGADAAARLAAHGFVAEKVGERAVVDLRAFTISGKDKKDIRNALNRADKAGCAFEMRPPGPLGDMEPALRRVSDAWLAMKAGSEKAFSLGRFDPDYLSRFSLAVARRQGEPVAFANIWIKDDLVTMDLMRFADEGPGGGMDYLFTKLLLWAQAEGYARVDFGLAPLAGLDRQGRPSTVARLGAFIYSRGGRFYSFEGLRAYKDKFNPVWEPAYIAAPNRWRAGAAAVAVAALTGGGVRNLLRNSRKGLAAPGRRRQPFARIIGRA